MPSLEGTIQLDEIIRIKALFDVSLLLCKVSLHSVIDFC